MRESERERGRDSSEKIRSTIIPVSHVTGNTLSIVHITTAD